MSAAGGQVGPEADRPVVEQSSRGLRRFPARHGRAPFWAAVPITCASSGVFYSDLVGARNAVIGAVYASAAVRGDKVVTAKGGVDQHEVAYVCDALNATGLPPLPAGPLIRHLAAHAPKGRGVRLAVMGVARASATPSIRMRS